MNNKHQKYKTDWENVPLPHTEENSKHISYRNINKKKLLQTKNNKLNKIKSGNG